MFGQGNAISYFTQSHEDSSFYCGLKLDENRFWFGGESGVLYEIDTLGRTQSLAYPFPGKDIYVLYRLSDDTILAAGKSASMAIFILSKQMWMKISIPSMAKNLCIYSIAYFNKKLYISGGHNRIAHSGKTIPRGFVKSASLSLNDWKTIRKSSFAFAFNLLEINNILYLSDYAPLRSRIWTYLDQGDSWKKTHSSFYLFHKMAYDKSAEQVYWLGGRNRNKGSIWPVLPMKKILQDGPFYWCHDALDNISLIGGDEGTVYFQQRDLVSWIKLQAIPKFSIYTIKIISRNTAFVAGHGKQLYRITLP